MILLHCSQNISHWWLDHLILFLPFCLPTTNDRKPSWVRVSSSLLSTVAKDKNFWRRKTSSLPAAEPQKSQDWLIRSGVFILSFAKLQHTLFLLMKFCPLHQRKNDKTIYVIFNISLSNKEKIQIQLQIKKYSQDCLDLQGSRCHHYPQTFIMPTCQWLTSHHKIFIIISYYVMEISV